MEKILDVVDLAVSFETYAGEVQAVRGVSFHLNSHETLAIVGESGSGKSVTVQAIMKLLPEPPAKIKRGSILYNDHDLTTYSDKQMEAIRGKEISMIFQDPMTSLNPTMKIGQQIAEGIRKHEKINKHDALQRAKEMLSLVGIPNPEANLNRYPHQFSGGMRQRVMIAMALACNSKVLLADEPTTALDVTMQAQILRLMNELKHNLGTSIVLITHDMGVVAQMADRIAVMYGGKIVETGSAESIFYDPQHPYTWGLLQSMPSHKTTRSGNRLTAIPGSPPDMLTPPKGCAFASRCSYCMSICKEEQPEFTVRDNGHHIACWLLDERAPKVERPKLQQTAAITGGPQL